jgi:hypothetical protein
MMPLRLQRLISEFQSLDQEFRRAWSVRGGQAMTPKIEKLIEAVKFFCSFDDNQIKPTTKL